MKEAEMKNKSVYPRILFSIIRFILTVAFFWSFDYLSKLYIRRNFVLGESIPILGDFIRITYVANDSAGFGILRRESWYALPIVIYVIGTILILIVYYYRPLAKFAQTHLPAPYGFFRRIAKGMKSDEKPKTNSRTYRITFPLLLAAAFGNTLDRFLHGYVTDFVDIGISSLRWPVFNVADAYMTVLLVSVAVFGIDEYLDIEALVPSGRKKRPVGDKKRGNVLLSLQIALIVSCVLLAVIGYISSRYEEAISSQYRWIQLGISAILAVVICYSYIATEIKHTEGLTKRDMDISGGKRENGIP